MVPGTDLRKLTTGTGKGSFDFKTAKKIFYDKLWQHKSSDFISKRTDFQWKSNKSGYLFQKNQRNGYQNRL
jgi:hypothetical protein